MDHLLLLLFFFLPRPASPSLTDSATMETGSPRKIQFTVPLLDTHLDPEAAEQVSGQRQVDDGGWSVEVTGVLGLFVVPI